jgi:thiamine-phosphate pyrophosphorylase
MASRCQLYLAIPAGFSGGAALVEAALAAAGAPSLLVVGEGDAGRLAEIVAAAHRQNAMVLTDSLQVFSAAAGFDGLHVASSGSDVKAARETVGALGVVGADCHLSRHEAMTLGEAGIDYVAFGRGGEGSGEALDDLAEMLDWWSALIEIPCAAYLPAWGPEAAWRKIVAAGADFIIPGVELWDDPKAVCERLERIAGYCSAREAQAHL